MKGRSRFNFQLPSMKFFGRKNPRATRKYNVWVGRNMHCKKKLRKGAWKETYEHM
jgi:hypothetical protein